jgi:hypothetical protein
MAWNRNFDWNFSGISNLEEEPVIEKLQLLSKSSPYEILPQVEKKNARHLKLGIKLKNYKQDI